MFQLATFATLQHTLSNTLNPHYKPHLFTLIIEIDLRKYSGFYPENSKTFGQYIRKARLDKGFATKVLANRANRVGCTPEIILEWEKDRCIPGLKLLQKLNNELDIPSKLLRDAVIRKYAFKEKVNLSFDANVLKGKLVECLDKAVKAGLKGRIKVFNDYCFGSLLRLYRYSLFMNSKEFAKFLSVDHSTVLKWEMGRNKPFGKMNRKIKNKLTSLVSCS